MKKNLIYNLSYQLLVIIIPFITVPYISRTIGAEGIGINSYTYSVIAYFMLFSMLGINNYGNRSIAKTKDNKTKLSKTFINIYTIQIIMSISMVILYLLYVLIFNNQYKAIALIQTIFLISTMLDINWLFFGLEKFKLTVTRNTVIKLISLVLIFTLIKDSNDLILYIIILAVSQLLSNILLWPFVKKEIIFIKPTIKELKKHIKPILILFIPVIAISLYKIMDKIMLGNLTSVTEVGYYEQAEKIINLPMTFISALGTVMMPRMSNLLANGKEQEQKRLIKKSMDFVMLASIPMVFGLMGVANNFVPLFLGTKFIKSGQLVIYLAPTVLFLSWANVIRTQYLIPKEKDKSYIISVFLGAIVNIILNLILIPNLQSLGAVIGTLAAEFTVMLYQTIAVFKELEFKEYIKTSIPYFISGLIMYIFVILLSDITSNTVLNIMIQISIGGLIYVGLNIKRLLELVNSKT